MKKIGCFLAAAALLPSLPAAAHHSFVAFDEESAITVTGTVTEFRFVNPHTYFFVDVTNDAGETVSFRVETETRNDLYRNGWRGDSLAVGDVLSVTVNPARDANRRYGRLLSLVKADGTFLDIPNLEDESGRLNRAPAASLEGVWLPVQTFREMFARVEPLGTELARAERAQMADVQLQPANVRCYNYAVLPMHLGRAHVFEIEFAGDDLILVHGEDMEFPRRIFMDGRAHPESVPVEDMDFMGHSTGHWEGDTLVVDTRYFRPRAGGNSPYPSGTRKHLIERYRLSEDSTGILIDWTLEDPEYLTAAVSHTFEWQHSPHIRRQPFSCDPDAAAEYLR